MSTSRTLIQTVSSVNLVFGLDWFAILGGSASREVRRIARQHKATHAVHAGDEAASVGITTLQATKRGTVLYSAAQLVARQFESGAVAVVMPLGDARWWLVAVHEGAVIARTDYVCTTQSELAALIVQLRQAYPALKVLDNENDAPSVSQLAGMLHAQAELQRVVYGGRGLSGPFAWFVLIALLIVLLRYASTAIDLFDRETPAKHDVPPEAAWRAALAETAQSLWIHGTAGTHDVLQSLYVHPVELAGWQLLHIECASHAKQWRCHADYSRADPETDNERFLDRAPSGWNVGFTSLEQLRARWTLPARGLSLAQTELHSANDNERHLFSRLQSIRRAFTQVTLDAPEALRVPAPVNQHGQAIPRPPDLPQVRTRAVRIQAPLRSLALLLPHCQAMAWNNVAISISPGIQPDLTHSRLNVTLQGILYEQD